MSLRKDWKEFFESLNANGVDYILVGALAFAYHAVPCYTGDLDVLVRPTEENLKRVLMALQAFGFSSLNLSMEDFMEPGAFVQLGYQPNRIDILPEISGVPFEEAWATAEPTELEGVPVRVLGRESLVKNKRAVGRPKDLVDLDALLGP
jgi:hypothetical protein